MVKNGGRALLMLFLFSDVSAENAAPPIRNGSQASIARELLPHGEAGVTLRQLPADGYASTEDCEIILATGNAGTIYSAHPFRFMLHSRIMARSHDSWPAAADAEHGIQSGAATFAGPSRYPEGLRTYDVCRPWMRP